MKTPRRILVVVTLRIGDVLLSTPLIRSLRLAWPQAEIDVLVFEHTEGILQRNPDIQRVIVVPTYLQFWKHLRLIFSLFRSYDIALTTLMGDRPTIYTWLAGKTRIGMQDGSTKNRWKQHLLTAWANFDDLHTHTVLMNLRLADTLGIKRCHEVVAAWTPYDERSAAALLPFDVSTTAFAVLHVHPKYAYKMWRKEQWAELAQWLDGRGIRIVLTGGKFQDELSYVDQIAQLLPPGTVNLAGKLSLAESAFIISKARTYVGPDTALTHVAAALGVPTIALFGPSNPVKWGPWPKGYARDSNPWRMKGTQRVNNVTLIQGSGNCVPCMYEGCERHVNSSSDCMQKISAASVIAAIVEPPKDTSNFRETIDAFRRARKKIAVIVPKYGLVGGGEKFASEITERLALNPNFEIHIFANRWVAKSNRIKFHKVPKVIFPRFLGPLFFAWFVKWKIDRMNFDLVHSHHWVFHADIFSAHGVPHAGWVRNVRQRWPSLFDYALSFVERRAMHNGTSSCFLPVSTLAMEEFRREYATLPGTWRVVHPGVDLDRFSTPDRDSCRADIRGRYGIGADDLLLLFVGMNFEVKGLDTIIAALAGARKLRPDANVRLLVVGRGDEMKYGKIAGSLGVADAVVFAGTQHAGLERYYRAADVFTLFSVYDTFGMVVLEAMAAGLPVIVSPNVGAKDLVIEGTNGFILPAPGDVAAATERIVQMSDKEKQQTMGVAAMRTASLHDWDKLAEQMEDLYQEMLADKSSISAWK